MLPIKLFRLVFCLFRFNRKQKFCFGKCQFRLFRIETSFEGHPSTKLTEHFLSILIDDNQSARNHRLD